MSLKTWDDLTQLAIGSVPWTENDRSFITGEPILYQALRAEDAGLCTREEALIQVVFALVSVKNEQHKMIMDFLNRSPNALLRQVVMLEQHS